MAIVRIGNELFAAAACGMIVADRLRSTHIVFCWIILIFIAFVGFSKSLFFIQIVENEVLCIRSRPGVRNESQASRDVSNVLQP